jgi:hypothetical protein
MLAALAAGVPPVGGSLRCRLAGGNDARPASRRVREPV